VATYTAAAGGGNWNAEATWEEGGGYPTAVDTAILDAGSGNVTVNVDSAVMDLDCTGYTGTLTLAANLSCYGNWLTVAGMTFTPSTYTTSFTATAAKNITTGGKQFYSVTWNGVGGVWTLQDALTQITGGLTAFTAGTLNLNGKTFTVPTVQTVTLASGFTLNVGNSLWDTDAAMSLVVPTGAILTISTGKLYRFAGFTVSGTGTVTFTGTAELILQWGAIDITSPNWNPGTGHVRCRSGTNTLSTTQPLYDLTTGYSGLAATWTLLSDVVVENTLTNAVGCTFNAATFTITVGCNFTNVGTFNCGTGTVIFNTSAKISVVSGSVTFNILQCVTPDKTVKFTAGETFICTLFDFSGTSGHLIILDTDTGAGTWTISDAAGTNTVEYCDITNSAAAGGATWQAFIAAGNVDGGGNSGWNFGGAAATDKMFLMFSP